MVAAARHTRSVATLRRFFVLMPIGGERVASMMRVPGEPSARERQRCVQMEASGSVMPISSAAAACVMVHVCQQATRAAQPMLMRLVTIFATSPSPSPPREVCAPA